MSEIFKSVQTVDEKDILEIVVISEKEHRHYTMKFNPKRNYKVKINDREYNIRKNKLLKTSQSLIDRIKKRRRYMIFFYDFDSEPIDFDFREPKVSSRILYLAVKSDTLNRGLRKVFSKPFSLGFDVKQIFFLIIIVAVVGYVIYLFMSGGITL